MTVLAPEGVGWGCGFEEGGSWVKASPWSWSLCPWTREVNQPYLTGGDVVAVAAVLMEIARTAPGGLCP